MVKPNKLVENGEQCVPSATRYIYGRKKRSTKHLVAHSHSFAIELHVRGAKKMSRFRRAFLPTRNSLTGIIRSFTAFRASPRLFRILCQCGLSVYWREIVCRNLTIVVRVCERKCVGAYDTLLFQQIALSNSWKAPTLDSKGSSVERQRKFYIAPKLRSSILGELLPAKHKTRTSVSYVSMKLLTRYERNARSYPSCPTCSGTKLLCICDGSRSVNCHNPVCFFRVSQDLVPAKPRTNVTHDNCVM